MSASITTTQPQLARPTVLLTPSVSSKMIGLPQAVMASTLIAAMTGVLPTEPNIYNALLRLVLWFCFARFAVGFELLWRPGPATWYVIAFLCSYGSWLFFYITGSIFYYDSLSFLSICGAWEPVTGFVVDTGMLQFLCISWLTIRIVCQDGVFVCDSLNTSAQNYELEEKTRAPVFLAGLIGALASLPFTKISGALAQPMLLISYWYSAALAVMVISIPAKAMAIRKFGYILTLVAFTGMASFMGSGLKGAIFMSVFYLFWLYGATRQAHRLRATVAVIIVSITFLVTLPMFQRAKEAFSQTRSASKTLDAFFMEGRELIAGRYNFSQRGSKRSEVEELWLYLGIRLCTASMTHKYYELYGEEPRGYESLWVSIQSMVPRVFDSEKVSTNYYYNELARNSGIGNREDKETSRKPTFLDESVIIWGHSGFWIGGIVFGLYIAGLEKFCQALAVNRQTLYILRFMTIGVANLPYFAVMLGATPFILGFIYIVIDRVIKRLWPASAI